MLVRLHAEGVLSEGQVARATGLHRTDIRRRADARGQQPTKDSSMNCDLNKLNVLSYANGFTLWHYTTEDAAADVVATNQETAP